MSKHVQTILSDEEHKKVRIKSIELGKGIQEFAKEALLEKCNKKEEELKRKEDKGETKADTE